MSMSISSAMLSDITSFRNPNGSEHHWVRMENKNLKAANPLKLVVAEACYIVTIPFAVVETAIAATATVFSACLPVGRENHVKMTSWLKSSAFSIAWASGDAVLNLFCNDLIQTEKVAMNCLASGNVFYAQL